MYTDYTQGFEMLSQSQKTRKLMDDEYRDAETGLVFCSSCHTPRQSNCLGRYILPVPCRCQEEKDAREEAALREWNKRRRLDQLVEAGVTHKAYRDYTFDRDDGRNPEITEICRRYAEHFKEMKQLENGILFYGNAGKGKTFFACCIANALLDRGIPVLVTSLSYLVQNRMEAMRQEAYKINLDDFDCIVLDDIGIEKFSPTAANIVDEISLLKKPVIVTTNLNPMQLKDSQNENFRQHSRIAGMCGTRLHIDNNKSRLDIGNHKGRQAEKILRKR